MANASEKISLYNLAGTSILLATIFSIHAVQTPLLTVELQISRIPRTMPSQTTSTPSTSSSRTI